MFYTLPRFYNALNVLLIVNMKWFLGMTTVRQVFASVLAWTVGAVAAVGVGLLALSHVGDGMGGNTGQPLTPEAVAREAQPASAPREVPLPLSGSVTRGTASKTPVSTRSAAPPAPTTKSGNRLVATSGGTAVVRCAGGLAYLVSWSPNEGYQYDNVERGPGDRVRVRFRSEERTVDLRVTCLRGMPQVRLDD